MLSLLIVGFSLCTFTWAVPSPQYYSYSPAVGSGSGSPYSTEGVGRITAVRIWENYSSYIQGIQLRYEYSWGPVIGRSSGTEQEILLFDGEAIIQVSGKYQQHNYIYQLVFTTNRGRSLLAGQASGLSFNFYPAHSESELRFISGRQNGNGITSLGAHWGMVYEEPSASNGTGHSMEEATAGH
ncbi:zymogen granule membrane protein 16-like [Megalops cyprinoides]|uniref:zymogen granule membrane protein 16-like n=1 Tax=Megalops cyprinoides TaxID=118141 RepID=UPI00186533D5|nr:zymogen granule membrane protein 16-like [Megalops cyprinoides]XP_036372213.1 zymogen granule membrane protein 16-like [Megalops cyprinoides]